MIVVAQNCMGQEVTINLYHLVYACEDKDSETLQIFLTKGTVLNLPAGQEAANHIREYARLRYRLGLEELARAQEGL